MVPGDTDPLGRGKTSPQDSWGLRTEGGPKGVPGFLYEGEHLPLPGVLPLSFQLTDPSFLPDATFLRYEWVGDRKTPGRTGGATPGDYGLVSPPVEFSLGHRKAGTVTGKEDLWF